MAMTRRIIEEPVAQKVQVVFFDVGGTLIHPYPSFTARLAHVCQEFGLPVTPEQTEAAEAAVWARIAQRADAGRGFSLSTDRSREFWLWVYEVFLEELGYARAAHGELPELLLYTFTRPETYRLYADVRPVIQKLRRAGLTLGVISNWEGWLERLMTELGIYGHFQSIAVSGLVGVEKPDPGIFLHALQATGVRPENAIHVGDNPRDDVEGAEAVGIRGVLLDRSHRAAPVMPGHELAARPDDGQRINSLEELPRLLGL
jgi:putative hydrolase of the HAD superfamily